MLENGFCEIDGIDPAELKAKMSPQRDSNIKAGGAVNSSGGGKSGSQSKAKRGKEDTKCQFCNKVDKNFTNNEALDLHFWKDCLMLTECKYCQ